MKYKQCATLHGHEDAVNTLAFSSSGQYLAAVGYAGALVWDVSPILVGETIIPIPTPFQHNDPSLVLSTALWVTFVAAKRDVLIMGSYKGDIIVWGIEQKSTKGLEPLALHSTHSETTSAPGNEIIALAADAPTVAQLGESVRIAAASQDGYVSVIRVSVDGEIAVVFRHNVSSNDFFPRSLGFVPSSSDLLIFSLHLGVIKRYNQAGQEIWAAKHGPSPMTHVSLLDAQRFVAHVEDHFALVNLDNGKILKRYVIGPQAVAFQKTSAFVQNRTYVVCGTDQGRAVLFHTDTGKPVQILDYKGGYGSMVQPVAACDVGNDHYIAIAGSYLYKPSRVMLWCKKEVVDDIQVSSDSSDKPDSTSMVTPVIVALAGIIGCILLLTGQI
ncbi:WD40-repeat-containing domain protein [Schizophyllum commune]|nr:WD40 repeat-like protein [Schizophyllum commune Loenen D]